MTEWEVEKKKLEAAIKRLIYERDCAIADIKTMIKEGECEVCPYNEDTCMAYDVECKWRGVGEQNLKTT